VSLYNSNNLCQKPLSLCLSPVKMASSLLNQIEKKSSKILFRLVCQNVFGTDCVCLIIYEWYNGGPFIDNSKEQ
jgi:hypothetical protein